MPSTGYRPGQIVACQESVHTPARLALELSQDLTRTTTALSQFTARSEACSDYAKTPRPCLIMPIWFEDDPLEVCVMGTFDKARRSELAAVHRYFNMPIYPHTEYREQDIYVKTTVEWPKNAWLVAYRFPPSLQLLDPWSINGVNPEVDTTQLEWLDHHCSSLLKRWKRAIEDKAHLQRLRTNYDLVKKKRLGKTLLQPLPSMPAIHDVLQPTVHRGNQGSQASLSRQAAYPPRSPTRTRQLGRRISAQWTTVKHKSRNMNGSRASVALSIASSITGA